MATSEARLLANRRNALLSTGPKTAEGKDRSRANALKHGLCATVLVPEDLSAVSQRANEWYYCLKPQNPHQAWLVDEIAVTTLRIDRSERIERRLRDRAMLRAEVAWDDDQALEAERLGATLGRRPAVVARQLRATPQGCDWLIARWTNLARAADARSEWTPEQTKLAFDLLGTELEAREGCQPGDLVDLDGHLIEPTAAPAEVARAEIARLLERRSQVKELDEVDRALVKADQYDEPNVELKRLRRYEGTLHSRLRWLFAQMKDPSPYVKTHPDFKPNWVDRVEPGDPPLPQPETAPQANIDLEADEMPEMGESPDIPKILANRAERKLRKAEARREARRRKVERLRA